jgi:plastocyanin
MIRAFAVCFTAVLLLATSIQAATPKPTPLAASVGPGFTITLKKAGAKVTNLKPGAYVIRVSDKSAVHNFHLTGPGLNKTTGVGFTGNKSFPVTLKRGTYRYVCDPHRRDLKGSFTVR